MEKVIRGEFPRPSEVREDVSPALEAICQKAMALRPEDRYATALHLAEDVERFLADEPVSVLPDNLPRRAARWARHHPVAVQVGVVSGLLVLLTVAAGAIISWTWYAEAVRQQETTLLRSSELAAVRWSTDLSLRWRILQHWADDPQLHARLQELAGQDAWQVEDAARAQAWLEGRADVGIGSLQVTSWYLNDAEGRLVARHLLSDRTRELLGQRFDYRSYFNGRSNDLPAGSSAEPLEERHLSAIYLSKGEDGYKVALSVPSRVAPDHPDQNDETIGVLTMTINLGMLKDADLIDMRVNTFQGVAQLEGIYLNQLTSQMTDPQSLARATDDVLQTIKAQNFGRAKRTRGVLIRNYTSPLDPPGTPPRPVAIAPVIVDEEWTGLVVVVQQHNESP